MAKFKVWDRVRVKPIYYGTEERNKIGVIHFIDVLKHYQVVFDDTKNIVPLIPEEYLELVEPEKEETKYFKYYVRGIPREIPIKLSQNIELDSQGFCKIKQAFEREPFPYYHFSLDDDALDAIRYVLPPNLDFSSLSNQWHFFPTSPIAITSSFVDKISKNIGLPHSVNFVEKHKRTTLVWKISFNEFETTKSEAHDEKFDYLYGFLMAYFKRVHQGESKTQIKKYLNAIVYPMTKKEQTAFLQGIFYENCGLRFKEAKEYLEKIKVKK